MNIYEKLQVIQTKLKAPKNQFNKFGGYSYRNCEDILEAVKPLLAEVKGVVRLTDAVVQIGERYYVEATATLYDCESENFISASALAREEETKKGMDGAQVTGASSSYARKYALNGLFAIDDNKDSDNASHLDKQLLDDAKSLNIDLEKMATYLKKTVTELTNEDLAKCIEQKRTAMGAKK